MKLCTGSLVGRDHWINGHMPVGKNNQDALGYSIQRWGVCGVVADGCGSGAYSEIGARLGVQAVLDWWGSRPAVMAPTATELTLVINKALMRGTLLFPNDPQAVNDHFLFTLLIAIVNPERTMIFGCGDGVFATEGIGPSILEPGEGNQPMYMGYNLLSPGKAQIVEHYSANYPERVLIGTDGLAHYPGYEREWQDWVQNQVQLTRKFRLHHKELPDDTTAVGIGYC